MISREEYNEYVEACETIIEFTLAGVKRRKDDDGIEGEKVGDLSALEDMLRGLMASEDKEEKQEELPNESIDLSLINVNPDGNDLVKRIKAIRRKPKKQQPKLITCLFHGAPGTGKTTLAKQMCHKLGVEPLVRSYADIQSKYVGDGEKNLQAIFKEARKERKALILDECDSLMTNRESTDKEWQKTMTNQFLTELDKHTGLFIATTNFVENLDAAVLRRLFLKLEFKWMTKQQKNKAMRIFFNKRVKDVPIEFLAAGDFKAVRERSLYEAKVPDRDRIFELLKEEVDYKKKTMKVVQEATRNRIGF